MKPIIKADAVPTIFKREPPETKKLILKIKVWQITIITLPQNSEISTRAYIFQRPFLRFLYSEGLIYGGKFVFQNRLGLYLEGNLRLKIDWGIACSSGALWVGETSLRQFQHGAFASKNIRAPDANACTAG